MERWLAIGQGSREEDPHIPLGILFNNLGISKTNRMLGAKMRRAEIVQVLLGGDGTFTVCFQPFRAFPLLRELERRGNEAMSKVAGVFGLPIRVTLDSTVHLYRYLQDPIALGRVVTAPVPPNARWPLGITPFDDGLPNFTCIHGGDTRSAPGGGARIIDAIHTLPCQQSWPHRHNSQLSGYGVSRFSRFVRN